MLRLTSGMCTLRAPVFCQILYLSVSLQPSVMSQGELIPGPRFVSPSENPRGRISTLVQGPAKLKLPQEADWFWQQAANSGLKQGLAAPGCSAGPKDGKVFNTGSLRVIPWRDLMAVTSPTVVSGVGGVSVSSRSLVDAVPCQNIFIFFLPLWSATQHRVPGSPRETANCCFFIRYYLSDSDHLRARQPACHDGQGLGTLRSNPCGPLLSGRRTSLLAFRVTVGAKG